jgi:C-terminal processing protease CtpA/Prc
MPSRWWCAFPVACWAAPLAAQQLGPVDRARLAAAVWAEARANVPAWDRVRPDWDSGFTALLRDALARPASRTDPLMEFRELRAFVALLGDGQAAILPPPAVAGRWARPPVLVRAVAHRPFLVDYSENDEMRVARPERGAEIVAVQGIPAEQWVRDSILPETSAATEAARWERAIGRMLEGPKGTALHLLLRSPGGDLRGASVTRSVSLADPWPLAPAPLMVDTLPSAVLWIRLGSLTDPDVARAFDRACGAFAGVRGVILDLRNHTGTGVGGRETGYRILGRLIDAPLVTTRWRTPQYRPAYQGRDMPDSSGAWFVAPADTIAPRRDLPAFAGPVVVLASARTGGAAEDLLIAFRNAGRGPIVGDTSSGSAGQVGEFPLFSGWRLRLTVTRDAFPNGSEVQGVGVAPEVPVAERVDDLLAGRDAPLEWARRYIAEHTLP